MIINKRIKEISYEAWEATEIYYKHNNTEIFNEIYDQKFAALIVKECLKLKNKNTTDKDILKYFEI